MKVQFGAMPPEHHILAGVAEGRRLRGEHIRDVARRLRRWLVAHPLVVRIGAMAVVTVAFVSWKTL